MTRRSGEDAIEAHGGDIADELRTLVPYPAKKRKQKTRALSVYNFLKSRSFVHLSQSPIQTPDDDDGSPFDLMLRSLALVLPLVSGLRVPVSRRDVLTRTAAIGAASCAPLLPVSAKSAPDYAGAKSALQELITKDENIGPTMVRLAWHSSGTYDKMSKTGGNGGGTIRFKEELAHGGNAGLDKMVAKLEPIHAKFPDVSYADLYVLAGATAIEAAGVKVPFKAGRVDAMDPSAVTPDGRLPDASKGNDPQKTAAALRKDGTGTPRLKLGLDS